MKRLASVLRVIDIISDWCGKAASYMLYPLIALLVAGVVARYFFNSPIIWVHDVSIYIYGDMGILVGAYVFHHNGHVRMDLIYNRLSARGKAVVDSVTAPILLFILIMLLWKGIELAEYSFLTKEVTATAWRGPVYPAKMIIPVATLILLLQGSAKFIRDLTLACCGKEIS